MKKSIALFAVIIVFLIGLSISCKEESHDNNANIESVESIKSVHIMAQKKAKRDFTENAMKLVKNIKLGKLERPLFRPLYLKFDENGSIYILESFELKIHKFTPMKSYNQFKHTIFGKGTGQGPGELTRVMDFKIYKDEIFLANEGSSSIVVYSTDASYRRNISLGKSMPKRFSFVKNKIVVGSYYAPPGQLFNMCDFNGNVSHTFGDYIDKSNPNNSIYHDHELSDPIGINQYYYLPYYLGFVGLYQGNRLLFAKETIDGLRKPEAVSKKVIKGLIVRKLKAREYDTAALNAVHRDFILIKAVDYRNKKTYWDIYNLKNFDYIASIKNPPISVRFDIHGNYLACVDETDLKVFDIKSIIYEIKERIKTDS